MFNTDFADWLTDQDLVVIRAGVIWQNDHWSVEYVVSSHGEIEYRVFNDRAVVIANGEIEIPDDLPIAARQSWRVFENFMRLHVQAETWVELHAEYTRAV